MFCKNCGKEIENDSKFCPHCGTPVAGQPASADPMQLLRTAAHTAMEAAGPAKDKLVSASHTAMEAAGPAVKSGISWVRTNSAAVISLAKAAAFVAMIFLWFSKVVSISMMGISQKFSMPEMSQDVEWLSYLTAVILAAGAVCALFPRICPKCSIPMLASGWTAFLFIIYILTGSSLLDDYSRYEPEFTVTFNGWLLATLSVGMLVLTVLEALTRKRSAKAPQITEPKMQA